MNQNLIVKILKLYNLELIEVLPSSKGYRNTSIPVKISDGRTLNIVFYKIEPKILRRIKNANAVSDYLASQGFPTRKSLMLGEEVGGGGKRIVKISDRQKSQYVCLYNYLPGSTIPWEAYTMKHIKLLGESMAKMHLELSRASLTIKDFNKIEDELEDQLLRMIKYFSNDGVIDAMHRKLKLAIDLNKLESFKKLLFALRRIPQKQILHLDFVRGNILFKEQLEGNNDPAISGILDFEKTSYGPKIIDIARTLAFLIVDCKYEQEEKVVKYFLHSGYQKQGKSRIPDIKFLKPLVAYFLMYDFYKFLKHNPYEFLGQNEHYTRTKGKLLSLKLINSL